MTNFRKQSIRLFSSNTQVTQATTTTTPDPKLQLDLAAFQKKVYRPFGVTPLKAFLDHWMAHMTEHPEKIPHISWPELLAFLKTFDRTVNDLNFGAVILQQCVRFSTIKIAQHYFNSTSNHTQAVLSLYMFILGKFGEETLDENLVYSLYEEIKTKNKGIWDLDTGERVCRTLAMTAKWRECLQIFEEMKFSGKPSPNIVGEVIASAFRTGDYDLGWSLMKDPTFKRPSQKAVWGWLHYAPKTPETLYKLFDYTDCYDFYLTDETIQELKEFFEHLKCKSVETVVTGGNCRFCKSQLQKNQLTPEEYSELTNAFLEKVLVDEDVFINSSPEEVEDYKSFIAKKGPYEIVLDGLNVAYSRGRDFSAAVQLERVVASFRGKKMLVIGRAHMRKWRELSAIKHLGAHIYLIADISQDDPFVIYATMRSGINARLVSKDFLRNHLYRLDDARLARLFRRWRFVHQLTIQTKGEDFRVVPFSHVAPVAQRNEVTGIWHIPFGSEEELKSPHSVPQKWLCVVPRRGV